MRRAVAAPCNLKRAKLGPARPQLKAAARKRPSFEWAGRLVGFWLGVDPALKA
jgi:hypothetical protein